MEDINNVITLCGITYEKKFIDCNTHGGNTPAMSDGTCERCFREKEENEILEGHEKFILSKKEFFEIPKKFYNCKFGNITAINQKQAGMIDYLHTYNFDKNVIMLGNVGAGKTTMAMATADRAIRENKTVAYVKYYNLTNLSPWSPEFIKLAKVDVLIIDEVGVSNNQNKDDVLFKLIDQRYDNEKYCILISNSDKDTFISYLSPSAYSKIRETSKLMMIDWQDLRINGDKK